uniref:LEM domain-containing protein n=1 Tax=Panagrellus redivivus TaxID=6233 RepID=A0A7E4VFA7_PANRE
MTTPVSKAIETVKDTNPFVTIPSEIRTRNTAYPILLTRPAVKMSLVELAMKAIMNHCTDFDGLPLPPAYKAELKKKTVLLKYVREKAAAVKAPVTPPRPRPWAQTLPLPERPRAQERLVLADSRRRRHSSERSQDEETGEPVARRRWVDSPERPQDGETDEPTASRRRRHSPERSQEEETTEPPAQRRRLTTPDLYFS